MLNVTGKDWSRVWVMWFNVRLIYVSNGWQPAKQNEPWLRCNAARLTCITPVLYRWITWWHTVYRYAIACYLCDWCRKSADSLWLCGM